VLCGSGVVMIDPVCDVDMGGALVPTPEQLAAQLAAQAPQLSQESVQEIIVLQLRLEGVARRQLTVLQDALAKENVKTHTDTHRGDNLRLYSPLRYGCADPVFCLLCGCRTLTRALRPPLSTTRWARGPTHER
jgi:hypothetical protein